MDTVDDQKKERDHEFIEKLITEYFSKKLLSMVEDMDIKKDDEAEAAHEYQEDEDDDEPAEANDDDIEYQGADAGENKYVKRRKQREKERRLQELKQWEFPERIGSYNTYTHPALEFSKQLCANIFGLDEAFFLSS